MSVLRVYLVIFFDKVTHYLHSQITLE